MAGPVKSTRKMFEQSLHVLGKYGAMLRVETSIVLPGIRSFEDLERGVAHAVDDAVATFEGEHGGDVVRDPTTIVGTVLRGIMALLAFKAYPARSVVVPFAQQLADTLVGVVVLARSTFKKQADGQAVLVRGSAARFLTPSPPIHLAMGFALGFVALLDGNAIHTYHKSRWMLMTAVGFGTGRPRPSTKRLRAALHHPRGVPFAPRHLPTLLGSALCVDTADEDRIALLDLCRRLGAGVDQPALGDVEDLLAHQRQLHRLAVDNVVPPRGKTWAVLQGRLLGALGPGRRRTVLRDVVVSEYLRNIIASVDDGSSSRKVLLATVLAEVALRFNLVRLQMAGEDDLHRELDGDFAMPVFADHMWAEATAAIVARLRAAPASLNLRRTFEAALQDNNIRRRRPMDESEMQSIRTAIIDFGRVVSAEPNLVMNQVWTAAAKMLPACCTGLLPFGFGPVVDLVRVPVNEAAGGQRRVAHMVDGEGEDGADLDGRLSAIALWRPQQWHTYTPFRSTGPNATTAGAAIHEKFAAGLDMGVVMTELGMSFDLEATEMIGRLFPDKDIAPHLLVDAAIAAFVARVVQDEPDVNTSALRTNLYKKLPPPLAVVCFARYRNRLPKWTALATTTFVDLLGGMVRVNADQLEMIASVETIIILLLYGRRKVTRNVFKANMRSAVDAFDTARKNNAIGSKRKEGKEVSDKINEKRPRRRRRARRREETTSSDEDDT